MKLWIIYKDGIGFSMVIAEMLQDRLEDYIDVFIGNAKKIDPSFLVEEMLDYLIIGDVINEPLPSLEIQNWLIKYKEITKSSNLILKAISGFCVTLTDTTDEHSWVECLQDNVKSERFFPPILSLKLNKTEMALDHGSLKLIRDYIDNYIDFSIDNEN